MTPHKLEAYRAKSGMQLEYDLIEPSKSPWACEVVMAKKKRVQLKLCCEFRYLSTVTIKDAYPKSSIDESLSKLGDNKFSPHWTWVPPSGRFPSEKRIEKRPDLHVD